MQRYFVTPEQFDRERVPISGDDFHHLTRVMRARVGERVMLCDGQGREAVAEIGEIAPDTVYAAIVEQRLTEAEPEIEVWIAQSLPKGDKMETVVQRGTEIGAARFIPFISERTVVQYDAKKEARRMERWRKIAKEAAEQAQRGRVPVVEEPCRWERLIERAAEMDGAWLCYEKERGVSLGSALREWTGQAKGAAGRRKVLLLIGPEGGFSEEEVARAESAGIRAVGLGRRILRTETAAMVGLCCILYEFGEMGG